MQTGGPLKTAQPHTKRGNIGRNYDPATCFGGRGPLPRSLQWRPLTHAEVLHILLTKAPAGADELKFSFLNRNLMAFTLRVSILPLRSNL
jgi:hypothetical protein